jgi:NOL1/NOP2/fmu family ribosome biogenesis protein
VLKPGGVLFYATCSYSAAENEEIAEWFINEYGAIFMPIQLDSSWGVIETTNGYRCWPHHVLGEGFFFTCFQKPNTAAPIERAFRTEKNKQIKKSADFSSLVDWIDLDGMDVTEIGGQLMAFPKAMQADWQIIQNALHPIYAGVRIGEWMRDKLIPDHALALSTHLSSAVEQLSLDYSQAIAYLQRKEIKAATSNKGWMVAAYQGLPLGWLNVLTGRVNNYYPKGLRILKDHL